MSVFGFLDVLAGDTPPDTEIRSLMFEGGSRFQIRGTSREPLALLARLQSNGHFHGLKLPSIQRELHGGRERFDLSGTYHE